MSCVCEARKPNSFSVGRITESDVSFESALQKLKSMFDCPTEDGHPAKGTWCANCREICDADGTNWCDRNWYLGSVLAVESAHKKEVEDSERVSKAATQSLRDDKLRMAGEIAEKDAEIASLRAKRNELYECNLKLRSLVRVLADALDSELNADCQTCGNHSCFLKDEFVCPDVAKNKELVAKAREACK